MKKTLLYSAVATFLLGNVTFAIAEEGAQDSYHSKGKMFEKMDADSDGKVTKEEFVAHSEKRFTKMDANGDGSITKEEAEQYYVNKKEKHQQEKEESGSTSTTPATPSTPTGQ